METAASDERVIILLAIAIRLVVCALLRPLSWLSTFDTSQGLLSLVGSPATLRWDVIHFVSIARDGYQYEQQLAFQPGWPAVLRSAGEVIRLACRGRTSTLEMHDLVLGGEIVANAAFVGAAIALYRLTKRLYSPAFARTATILYLLQPSQAVMSSPYTEPLYALCTFAGFGMALQRRWVWASSSLAMATSLRATGVFSAGVVGWLVLFDQHSAFKWSAYELALPGLLGAIIVCPFGAFQAYTYYSFCASPTATHSEQRPWCTSSLPLAYSFVQREYWNVGVFRYWTRDQIPNIAIAAPVLLVSLSGTYTYLQYLCRQGPNASRAKSPQASIRSEVESRRGSVEHATAPSQALPFHIQHTALTLLLILSSHTQIALRVSSGDPVVWWTVADMAFHWTGRGDETPEVLQEQGTNKMPEALRETGPTDAPGKKDMPKGRENTMTFWGRIWIWWVVLWAAVGLVLWAGHYPPA